ncbi:versican core protein-like [Crassostrea angulata]|uniref:versican core protein-like n=1 Tax=Magallana angulata TaxID=2784310 RepID=UPI0022B10265|nr:versican core protein-like [Crassostrea angulata]
MLLSPVLKCPWILYTFLLSCNGSLQPGFSKLQRGQRLDRKLIQSFVEVSFLDCVKECLVTPRCKSVNYIKGANFCEINYENKMTAEINYVDIAGWVYSEKEHWPKDLAGACAYSNCQINQTCKHKKYSKGTSYECVLSDCGIPNRTGIDLNTPHREDAIGIRRRIHASCSAGYFQFGSGRLICQSNGEWKYDIACEEGWVQYENHIYRIFTEKKNWDGAKEHCESRDAYLVEIESSEENTWIHEKLVYQHFLSRMDHCSYNIYDCTVWIGGSDKNTESQFIWSKSGNLITFLNWSIGSPNNLKGNQDCIEMFASNGRWNDRECDHNTPFICEKSLN